MGKKVRVTKVTLEYAFEGRLYSLEFPEPAKLGSIVFSKIDLDRVKTQQAIDTGVDEVPSHRIDPKSLAATGETSAQVLAVNQDLDSTSVENGTEDRSLWWHASSCAWFHPEEGTDT